jgi:virulence factor
MKNHNPLRVGVIGCGWIMRSTYVPTLQSLAEQIQVAAVCDLNAAQAGDMAAQFVGATAYTDAAAMLKEAGLDAVMVLTTEKVNARMARMVMEANLPVYLEKPPAVNSAELEEFIAAEAGSPIKIYTAFNRRHTPLYASLDFSTKKLKKVSGALKRTDRKVETFPMTAIHVIDSSQYFAGAPFKNWKIDFEKKAESSSWMIRGELENRVECELEIVPHGDEFDEHLKFETESATLELPFPNTNAVVPEGEIIVKPRDGSPKTVTRGDKAMPLFEAMGFRDCLLDFIGHLETGKNSAHRLTGCRATIAIVGEMVTTTSS